MIWLPVVHLANAWHGISDHQAKTPVIQIRRCPQTLDVLRIAGEEVKVVAHLGDEVLSMVQFLQAASMVAGQVSRKLLSLVDRQVTEDPGLQRGSEHFDLLVRIERQ